VDSCASGYGSVVRSWEQSNEPSASIKGGEFPDQLSNYQLV
jgi:hypothetical protein